MPARPQPRRRPRAFVALLVAALALAPAAVLTLGSPGAAAPGDPPGGQPSLRGVSAGARGAVLVDAADRAGLREVRAAGADRLVDYGSFSLWTVPRRARADVAALPTVSDPDTTDRIRLRDRVLDTSRDVPAPSTLAATASTGSQLRLVQFVGPMKQAWLSRLTSAGARVVSYIPDNAYVVWVPAAGAARIDALVGEDPVVQYSGPFDPAYRLAPALGDLVGKVGEKATGTIDVTVQVVAGDTASFDAVTQGRRVVSPAYTLVGLRTVTVRADRADLAELAEISGVVDVEPYVAPRLDDERQDQLLAGNLTTTGGGATVPSGTGYLDWLDQHGFPHTPSSYPLVAVVDDGIDDGTDTPLHPDFFELGDPANPDRLAANGNCTSDPAPNAVAGHGNLNAGIVGGYDDRAGGTYEDTAGYQYGLGVSPYGRVSGVKIFTNGGAFDLSACGGDIPGITEKAYAQGAGLTSNSWGADVAGAYTADSQAFDALTRDASPSTPGLQQMLHVIAAGNAGSGVRTVGSPGTAKNVLTVGATENVREDGTLDGCSVGTADNDSDIATFSSRGPTLDGRVKPDLVAAGTHVTGPASQDPGYDGSGVCGDATGKYHPAGNTLYTWSSGTSHSTPAISGAASLVQEYYGRVLDPGATASPAMLKALLANVPRYLSGSGSGGTLPSNNQGWGVPDLGRLFDPGTARLVDDQDHLFTASGQSVTRVADVSEAGKPVRVTLAWTDAPGATTGASYVNDLDLEVTVGGHLYRGNVFSGGSSTTGGSADAKDNVESVFLPAGTTGPLSIRVLAANIAGDGVPGNGTPLDQDYALTTSNLTAGSGPVPSPAGVTYSDVNDDSRVDPGEPLTIHAAVTNAGDVATTAGTGTLEVVSGDASVEQGTSAYRPIPAGGTAQNVTDYRVEIGSGAACSSVVVLRHTYQADGQTVTEDLSLRIGPSSVGSFTSTDVPKAIPDNNATGVTSNLPVTDVGNGLVGTVKVHMSISHTYDADVSAYLVSPTGTSVSLVLRRGGGGDNFNGTTFDDGAATAISAGTPPFAGSYRPETPLSALQGQPMAGTWKLRATDTDPALAGSITGWSLDIVPSAAASCTAFGAYVDVTGPGAVPEGDGSATFDVALRHADPGTSYSVTLGTADGSAQAPSDYAATRQTFTWDAGDTSARSMEVPIADGHVFEHDESFTVRATAGLPATTATATIVDDDLDTRIAVGQPQPTAESAGTLHVPITLTDSYDEDTYTVHVATSDGTATAPDDYTAVDQTVTFGPGSPRTQIVAVPIVADAMDEPDETLAVTIDDAQGSASGAVPIDDADATGTILDDDATPQVSVADTSVTEGTGADTAATFTVSLSNPRSVPVSVAWRTRAGSASGEGDYEPSHGVVDLAPGETTATVQVPVLGDALDERNEDFTVRLADPVAADLGRSIATGTIVDDDVTPTIAVGKASAAEGRSGLRTFTFPVRLSTPSGRSVAVRWSTADGTAKVADKDYVAAAGLVYLDPGQTTASITVKVRGDRKKEKNETFKVVCASPVNARFGRATGVGTIRNDD